MSDIDKDIKEHLLDDYTDATYYVIKETIENSGPDYGHGQLFQLGKIILQRQTPQDERINAYRLIILASLALLQYNLKDYDKEEQDAVKKQLNLWEKNGIKDDTKN